MNLKTYYLVVRTVFFFFVWTWSLPVDVVFVCGGKRRHRKIVGDDSSLFPNVQDPNTGPVTALRNLHSPCQRLMETTEKVKQRYPESLQRSRLIYIRNNNSCTHKFLQCRRTR